MTMNVLEKQVLELSDKVDSLHGVIAQLAEKVDNGMSAAHSHAEGNDVLPDAGLVNRSPMAARPVTGSAACRACRSAALPPRSLTSARAC